MHRYFRIDIIIKGEQMYEYEISNFDVWGSFGRRNLTNLWSFTKFTKLLPYKELLHTEMCG